MAQRDEEFRWYEALPGGVLTYVIRNEASTDGLSFRRSLPVVGRALFLGLYLLASGVLAACNLGQARDSSVGSLESMPRSLATAVQ